MPVPTYVQEAETAFNTNATPKTTAAFSTLVGDILASMGGGADALVTAVTPTLTGETFTSQENLGSSGNNCRVDVRTATIATAGTGETVSLARTGDQVFGGNVLTFRASDGIGAAESAHITTGTSASTLNITTTQANSSIAVLCLDWTASDGASRAWRTVNGSGPVEVTYYRDTTNWGVYIGYYADAGAIGAKTVGLTAPTMRWTIAAIEVKGTAGGGEVFPPNLVMSPYQGAF